MKAGYHHRLESRREPQKVADLLRWPNARDFLWTSTSSWNCLNLDLPIKFGRASLPGAAPRAEFRAEDDSWSLRVLKKIKFDIFAFSRKSETLWFFCVACLSQRDCYSAMTDVARRRKLSTDAPKDGEKNKFAPDSGMPICWQSRHHGGLATRRAVQIKALSASWIRNMTFTLILSSKTKDKNFQPKSSEAALSSIESVNFRSEWRV